MADAAERGRRALRGEEVGKAARFLGREGLVGSGEEVGECGNGRRLRWIGARRALGGVRAGLAVRLSSGAVGSRWQLGRASRDGVVLA